MFLRDNTLLTPISKQLLFTPNKGDYGYGFEIVKFKGQDVIGHSGAIHGFRANMFNLPATGITVILLANYADVQTFELYEGLKRIAANGPFDLPKTHQFIDINIADYRFDLGQYLVNDKISLTLREQEGRLIADIAVENGLVLYPESKDNFYIRAKNAYLKLVRNERNEVTAVKVIKGERASVWKRKM